MENPFPIQWSRTLRIGRIIPDTLGNYPPGRKWKTGGVSVFVHVGLRFLK